MSLSQKKLLIIGFRKNASRTIMKKQFHKKIWIVDFGSQYTQLITRKSRELGYSSEIITLDECRERFDEQKRPECLVLSSGPQSVFEDTNDYSFMFKDRTLPLSWGFAMACSSWENISEE